MSKVRLGTYSERRGFSDQFIPQVIEVMRRELAPMVVDFVVAPFRIDTTIATDLILAPQVREPYVAVRIRQHGYMNGFANEFTVRDYTDGGGLTEFDKVMRGCGTHGFYGFATADGLRLAKWTLFDLDVFRGWCRSHFEMYGRWPGSVKSNPGDRTFRVFRFDDGPKELVIASSSGNADQRQLSLVMPPPLDAADAAFAGLVAAVGGFENVREAAIRFKERSTY